MKEIKELAAWKLNGRYLTGRSYLNLDREMIGDSLVGSELPAHQRADALASGVESEYAKSSIQSARIFTSLPKEFISQLLQIQQGEHPIKFPTIKMNKLPSVGHCIRESSSNDILAVNNWNRLGWKNQQDYDNWLATPMLFAFSGTAHYCSAPRVFDFSGKEYGVDIFQELPAAAPVQSTNILSIAGFEFRNFEGRYEETYEGVKAYSSHIMQLILGAANETNTLNVVLIPFGMGVFLPQDRLYNSALKQHMLDGWIQALNEYNGENISLYCCLLPGQYDEILRRLNNSKISLIDTSGVDAYGLTNHLQNKGQNTFMVNAGDHDWIMSLEPNRNPGQCGKYHTLYHSTSDEYLSLMTLFSFFSIRNMQLFLEENFSSTIQTIIPYPEKKHRAAIVAARPEAAANTEVAEDGNRTIWEIIIQFYSNVLEFLSQLVFGTNENVAIAAEAPRPAASVEENRVNPLISIFPKQTDGGSNSPNSRERAKSP
ncbi:MAG: hypothetical protein EBY16_05705 [Gammaproteobacteria bacterium]|nr:hypothetical protein [Gammaproteobacteria bacterium]